MPRDPLDDLHEQQKKQRAAALWVDTAAWNESDIPPRPWIAPGYLLRKAITMVCGPPSALKSSLMLAWACAIVLGRDHGRFRPGVQGTVVVYNAEDDDQEQRRRLSAVLRQFGASPSGIAGKLIRIGPKQIGTLLTRSEDGALTSTPAMLAIEEVVEFYKPVAFMADPLAELHNCEENDNNALRSVIAEFRTHASNHDMATCIAHHTRKGSAASPGDPDVARGASAIIGAARIVFTTMGMSEADAQALGIATDPAARSHFVRLDSAKSNYAALREAEWFQKAIHILGNNEAVAAAEPWTPPVAKTASQSDVAALATAIERGAPGGEPWSPKLSQDARSVRHLLKERGFLGDAEKQVLKRLQSQMGVTTSRYARPGNRVEASGLHIDHVPAAKWVDAEGQAE